MKFVLPTQTFIVMMSLSTVFSGCVDPYYAPNTRYQSQNNRYVSPTPRYVAPTQRYVAPTPVYAPQPQTKVIVVEQPRYRDSGRMDRYDHGNNYRDGSNRMDNHSNPMQSGSGRMDNRQNPVIQPTSVVQPSQGQSDLSHPDRHSDRWDNHRMDNHSMPMQNGTRQMDNRVNPIVQPTTPTVQPRPTPVIQPQPHVESRPTPMAQPTTPSAQPQPNKRLRDTNNANPSSPIPTH